MIIIISWQSYDWEVITKKKQKQTNDEFWPIVFQLFDSIVCFSIYCFVEFIGFQTNFVFFWILFYFSHCTICYLTFFLIKLAQFICCSIEICLNKLDSVKYNFLFCFLVHKSIMILIPCTHTHTHYMVVMVKHCEFDVEFNGIFFLSFFSFLAIFFFISILLSTVVDNNVSTFD